MEGTVAALWMKKQRNIKMKEKKTNTHVYEISVNQKQKIWSRWDKDKKLQKP